MSDNLRRAKDLARNGLFLAATALTVGSTVIAHQGNETTHGSSMMMGDGSWMHSGTHMMGYDMWGMGWFGLLFGISLWILVILSIIYLYQRITEQEQHQKEENEKEEQ